MRPLRRLSAIGALGWRFQWITWDDVEHRAEELVTRLAAALAPAA